VWPARTIFGQCFFDAEKCFDGIQTLRHYRYEFDEKLKGLRKEPVVKRHNICKRVALGLYQTWGRLHDG
jgi:hypothetical protein